MKIHIVICSLVGVLFIWYQRYNILFSDSRLLVWLCNKIEDYVVVVSDEISNYEILEMAGV